MVLRLLLSAPLVCGIAGCATNTSVVYRPVTPRYPALSVKEKARSVVRDSFSVDPHVENGTSYEKVIVSVPQELRSVAVPASARVITSRSVNAIEIYLRKTLHWLGHTSEYTSIATEGPKMGVGGKIKDTRLFLATFGDAGSFEGGSGISAVIAVPEHLRTVKRKSLNYGDDGRTDRMEAFKTEGWFVLPSTPDPMRTFEQLNKSGA